MGIVLLIIIVIIAILGMIISPILTCRIVREKGHDTSLWGIFGFFAGALAVIAAACMKDKNAPQEIKFVSDSAFTEKQRETENILASQGEMQKIVCPVCGKEFEIDRSIEETHCPYCGKKLKRKNKR